MSGIWGPLPDEVARLLEEADSIEEQLALLRTPEIMEMIDQFIVDSARTLSLPDLRWLDDYTHLELPALAAALDLDAEAFAHLHEAQLSALTPNHGVAEELMNGSDLLLSELKVAPVDITPDSLSAADVLSGLDGLTSLIDDIALRASLGAEDVLAAMGNHLAIDPFPGGASLGDVVDPLSGLFTNIRDQVIGINPEEAFQSLHDQMQTYIAANSVAAYEAMLEITQAFSEHFDQKNARFWDQDLSASIWEPLAESPGLDGMYLDPSAVIAPTSPSKMDEPQGIATAEAPEQILATFFIYIAVVVATMPVPVPAELGGRAEMVKWFVELAIVCLAGNHWKREAD